MKMTSWLEIAEAGLSLIAPYSAFINDQQVTRIKKRGKEA